MRAGLPSKTNNILTLASAAVVLVIVFVAVAPLNVPKFANVAWVAVRVNPEVAKRASGTPPKAPPAQVNRAAGVFANVKPVGAVILPESEKA